MDLKSSTSATIYYNNIIITMRHNMWKTVHMQFWRKIKCQGPNFNSCMTVLEEHIKYLSLEMIIKRATCICDPGAQKQSRVYL